MCVETQMRVLTTKQSPSGRGDTQTHPNCFVCVGGCDFVGEGISHIFPLALSPLGGYWYLGAATSPCQHGTKSSFQVQELHLELDTEAK